MEPTTAATTVLYAMTPPLQPPVTGEDVCAALGPVARNIEAVIPKGRGVWELHLTSQEVATGLEIAGLRIRGHNVEVTQHFPGGTWVRVRGFPIDVSKTTVYAIFLNFGEIVSGPHHVMWKGTSIKTGDRTMKIKLEKNIPQSFSTMEGKLKVTARYKDQPQTCAGCLDMRERIAKETKHTPKRLWELQLHPNPNRKRKRWTLRYVEKKEKKERKEKKKRKKNSEPVTNSTADGKRKDAPLPESMSTPTPIGRHRLPQAIPVYKVTKQ